MSRLVLDAGAFVAFEQGDAQVRGQIAIARRDGVELLTTSPIIAQVWRSGRQALLARLILATKVDAPDEAAARRAGELLAKTKTTDVVDALVVGLVRSGDTIVTSDPHDIGTLLNAIGVDAAIVDV